MSVSSLPHAQRLLLKEKIDSDVPPQMDKNTVMYLRPRKVVTSHY